MLLQSGLQKRKTRHTRIRKAAKMNQAEPKQCIWRMVSDMRAANPKYHTNVAATIRDPVQVNPKQQNRTVSVVLI